MDLVSTVSSAFVSVWYWVNAIRGTPIPYFIAALALGWYFDVPQFNVADDCAERDPDVSLDTKVDNHQSPVGFVHLSRTSHSGKGRRRSLKKVVQRIRELSATHCDKLNNLHFKRARVRVLVNAREYFHECRDIYISCDTDDDYSTIEYKLLVGLTNGHKVDYDVNFYRVNL